MIALLPVIMTIIAITATVDVVEVAGNTAIFDKISSTADAMNSGC